VSPGGVISATFSSRGKPGWGEDGGGVGGVGGTWSRSHAVYLAVSAAVQGASEAQKTFSKVSALGHLLFEVTVVSTFEVTV
jgi:hypothetical protein